VKAAVPTAPASEAGALTAELPRRAASVRGCYELRGPAPVGGRLLGVPGTVRLLDEPAPQGSDSSWRRADGTADTPVASGLIWRAVDSTTVELRVRGPLDSIVVRFRANGSGLPVPDAPASARTALATRVVCP
jgi:hypothetical protein